MTDARKKADEAWAVLPRNQAVGSLIVAIRAEITAHLEASIKDPESPLGYLYAKREEDLQAEHDVASERQHHLQPHGTWKAICERCQRVGPDDPKWWEQYKCIPAPEAEVELPEPESGEWIEAPEKICITLKLNGTDHPFEFIRSDIPQPRTVSREEVIEAYRWAGGGKNDIAPLAEVVAARLNQHLGLTTQPEEES
jgi:hypothetical protein